jgi:hypothetical protein
MNLGSKKITKAFEELCISSNLDLLADVFGSITPKPYQNEADLPLDRCQFDVTVSMLACEE